MLGLLILSSVSFNILLFFLSMYFCAVFFQICFSISLSLSSFKQFNSSTQFIISILTFFFFISRSSILVFFQSELLILISFLFLLPHSQKFQKNSLNILYAPISYSVSAVFVVLIWKFFLSSDS